MKDIQRVVTIIVGAVVLFFAYNFWFGSGIFAGWFVPKPPAGFDTLDGALRAGNPAALRSAGSADLFSQAMEILFTILSTVGTVAIAIALKLIQWLSRPFESAANEFAVKKESTQSLQKQISSRTKSKGFDVYLKVVAQAIIDGDVAVIESIANKMHGETFMQAQQIPREVELTPGGFPITEGGE
jgi:hypothetical protein